jgi:hypothetical protein
MDEAHFPGSREVRRIKAFDLQFLQCGIYGHGEGGEDALVRLETPVGRGRNQRTEAAMIGAISNWPILMPKNLTTQIKVFGHAVC